MCVITTKGMISGEVLKHRNGLFARRGQPSRVSRRNLLGPPAMASLSMLGLSVSVRTEGHDSQASSLRPHQRRTSTRDSACGSAACGSCYAIDSRSPSGAQTMVFWSNCSATRLADTAVFRQAIRTRSDSIMPSRLRGVTVRWPAKAAWAAFWASRSSFLPRRAAILPVGRRDLEDRNASLLHEAQQPCAIAARGFYADALQVPIALRRRSGRRAAGSPRRGPPARSPASLRA
jgi:hypothetical protein